MLLRLISFFLAATALGYGDNPNRWILDSAEDWRRFEAASTGLVSLGGAIAPGDAVGSYRSRLRHYPGPRRARMITLKQDDMWLNWEAVDPIGPSNLGDAPVFLARGPGDYWMFGRYGNAEQREDFAAEDARLPGFDIPLKTTPFPKQFDAPGGLKNGLGGYHAWQSRDLVHWVHHGPVTEHFSRWVTSAEYADGKAYIYYDFPNDQDPHLYIDADLEDGRPGNNMGLVFKDPSNGSDCAVIRDLEGNFHLIVEDWSPINARKHSWDSPLTGHAVSADGVRNFRILPPPVDHRTTPTGRFEEHPHPHWTLEDPERFPSSIARYEVHEPEQDAYGDWAAIGIGGQVYLFGDYHPAGKHGWDALQVAWFTAEGMNRPFRFCGSIGQGHPDPDIAFADGRFVLVTQTKADFVSPGPWVERIEVRVGVDTSRDGAIDLWTPWQEVKESYTPLPGFAKQVARKPAAMDLTALPPGYAFAFEIRLRDSTTNASKPVLDAVSLEFTPEE